MKKTIILFVVVALFASCKNNGSGGSGKSLPLSTKADTLSYIIGMQTGLPINILKQGESEVKINLDIVNNGLAEAANDNSRITEDEARQYMQELSMEFRKAQQKKTEAESSKNLEKAEAFLAENKAKEGVTTTESGLQHEIITEGTGASPKETDKVKVHYRGTLSDGTEFDSSYKRGEPIEFNLKGVIKGWTEGLQLMKVGGKSKLYIHPDLGYGKRGTPDIPASSALVFEVELLDIVTPTE